MRNERNVSGYFLYVASNNLLGLAKLKEAMWKVDPGGRVMFSDATDFDQTVLFQLEPDRTKLRSLIAERFAGRRPQVQQVEHYVVKDTPCHVGHYLKVLARGVGTLTPTNRRCLSSVEPRSWKSIRAI
jgi:hypothetical protein